MKTWFMTVGATAILAAMVGSQAHSSGAEAKPATAETLRQLEAEFMKEALARGSQGYMSYCADDAVELPNGADAIEGKENIAMTMGFLDNKENQLTWTPAYSDISASGDREPRTQSSDLLPKVRKNRVRLVARHHRR